MVATRITDLAPPARQLDYGLPPRSSRRRLRLSTLVLLVAAAVAAAGSRWGPPWYHQARYIAWQRSCMSYTRPGAMVVYAEDVNTSIADWVDTRPGYVTIHHSRAWGVGHVPPVWADGRAPRQSFGTPPGRSPGMNDCQPFLHARRNGRGQERLVAVTLWKRQGSWAPDGGRHVHLVDELVLTGVAYEPATWRPGSALRAASAAYESRDLCIRAGNGLRLYAGQPDPADPSRFSIVYDLMGDRGTIDGRLNDDDTVTLTVRDRPVKGAE